MEEYDPHITIDPITSILKHPDYCVRKLTFDHLNKHIETPFKVFSGKKLGLRDFNNFTSGIDDRIVENGRYIKGYNAWNTLKYLLTNANGDERNFKLMNFFRIDPKLWDTVSLTTISLVFPKNPYDDIAISNKTNGQIITRHIEAFSENSMIFLLQFIYSRSSACVLVPDIKMQSSSGDPIISIDKYLEHIDECVSILSQWNKKPIFVPLQIDRPVVEVERILDHYAEKKYSNIWINFLAHQCDASYIANIRSIRTIINKKMKSLDPILYYTHIQKEITPNIQLKKVLASDILTQFNGADFIGINSGRYDDSPGFSSEGEKADFKHAINLKISLAQYKLMKSLHKNRLFDPNTYYYYNLDSYPRDLPTDLELLRTNDSINRIANGVLLYGEIERTRKYAIEIAPKNLGKAFEQEIKVRRTLQPKIKRTLKEYLELKQGLNDNPIIRDGITDSASRQLTFFDEIEELGDL